jgi:uncharacterized membrane protein
VKYSGTPVPPSTAGSNGRHANVRALAKAISWRLLGSLGTSALVLFFTRRWDLAFSIGGVEGIAKIGLYFLHERVWDRISFGRHLAAPAPRAGEDPPSPPQP